MIFGKHEKQFENIHKHLDAMEKREENCCKEVVDLLKKILAGQGGNRPGPLKTLTFHIGTPTEK